uniref:Chemokine interleukin-8-like domain-containing protein n=1 Tax=Anguilla anguilla TaxID=7936 RepID=A0A0E9Q452_ANGAN
MVEQWILLSIIAVLTCCVKAKVSSMYVQALRDGKRCVTATG